MSDSPAEIVFGVVALIIALAVVLPLIGSLANVNHQSQCASEINQINDLNVRINAMNAEKVGVSNQLNACQIEYSKLISSNITKQDFTELKGSLNQTNIFVNNTYSRLENIENKINNFNNWTVNLLNVSFAVNIGLIIEFLSLAIWNSEFALFIGRKIKASTFIKKYLKKKE